MSRLFLFLLISLPALAGEVSFVGQSGKLIGVTPSAKETWAVEDSLCIMKGGKRTACGRVQRILPNGILAQLSMVEERPLPGDTVVRSPLPKKKETRETATATPTPTQATDKPFPTTPAPPPGAFKDGDTLAVGRFEAERKVKVDAKPLEEFAVSRSKKLETRFGAGVNLSNPFIGFESVVAPTVTFGATFTYIQTSLYEIPESGFGTLTALTYYPHGAFKSVFFQVAPGFFLSSADYEGRSGSFGEMCLQVLSGWRFNLSELSLGFGVGTQYFYMLANEVIPKNREFLLPVVALDLSLLF